MATLSDKWAVHITKSTPDYAIGTWGDIFLIVWIGQTSLSAATTFSREIERFSSVRPEGIGLVDVILKKATLPKADVRKLFADILVNTNILVSVAVMEGLGFRAAAVRSFVQGLNMLARHDFPHRIFGTVNECANWFISAANEKKPSWKLSTDEFTAAMNEFLRKTSKG